MPEVTGAHDGDAGPHGGERAIERASYFRQQRRGRNRDDGDALPVRRFLRDGGDAQLWICREVLESFAEMPRVFTGEDGGIEVGAGPLREPGLPVAAGGHSGATSRRQRRLALSIFGQL